MNATLLQLAARIQDDLRELERVVKRTEEGWKLARRSADDHYLDGVALNLHGFYSGLERIFELIATNVDGTKPSGENWHQTLLLQMLKEIPGLRPAVVSENTYKSLDNYRGFRHVVRNVYTFNFDPAKLAILVADLRDTLARARAELIAFAAFLEQQGSE